MNYRYLLIALGLLTTPSAQAIEIDVVEQVKDIVPGMVGSYPEELANVNGTLYFVADDGVSGEELWRSDGTETGTAMVKDINPAGSSFPINLTNVRGTLFFSADDGVNGEELWKSDGTAAGTIMVADLSELGHGHDSSPSDLINVNGTLFFAADTGFVAPLWKSDGTAAGTTVVDVIAPANPGRDGYLRPESLTNINGTLFFSAFEGIPSYTELWKSDGTRKGTVLVKDIWPGYASASEPTELTNVDDTLFFQADDGVHGRELWKSDGTEVGTVLVKDINPGGDSLPERLTDVNGTLYFVADDGTNGVELWKSDGTEAGTVMVKDVNPVGASSPLFLTIVNESLFFQANDGANGHELWKTDGTEAGTVIVTDIAPVGDSFPQYLTHVNGTLYFSADSSGTYTGFELWKTDGTTAGTVRVKDINPSMDGSFPEELVNLNGVLYFRADDGVTGSELWRAYVRTDTPPVFDDVPVSHPFYNAITNFAISGYTSGCSVTPSLYCPDAPVTRAQLAVFLIRGVNGQDFVPEPATGTVFDDVPIGSFAAAWIETFRELQITGGCSANPPLYCPGDSVTRAQMAAFLLRVIRGSAYTPPTATSSAFADVNVGDFAANWIEQLAKEGITGGCGNGNFCPNDPVTRGQMAAFLTRVFHTPQLFGPALGFILHPPYTSN